MEAKLYNNQGKEAGVVKLDDNVFNIDPNDHAIYLDVKQYLAHQRQGTHKVKERGEVQGSTKKIFRQKGTGGARQGSKRAPHFRHGGTVHGPRPRDYSFKLNKKLKQLARRSALAYKTRNNSLAVIDLGAVQQLKTKQVLDLINNMQLTNNKLLFVTHGDNGTFYRSGKNIPKVNIKPVNDLNTYDIVNAEKLILFKGSVEVLTNWLAN